MEALVEGYSVKSDAVALAVEFVGPAVCYSSVLINRFRHLESVIRGLQWLKRLT